MAHHTLRIIVSRRAERGLTHLNFPPCFIFKMKIQDKFKEYLQNKELKERTVENYLYYFKRFNKRFNQESVTRFLSQKRHQNSTARSFLINLQHFLKTNYKELKIDDEYKSEIIEVEFPKLSGRIKQKIIRPIPHEQIAILERCLDTDKLKLQLLLSYYCGLRLGELLRIEIISFNWETWKKDTDKMGECRVLGKGSKEGIALVPSFVMKRVAKYVKEHRFGSVNSRLFVRDGEVKIKNIGSSWQKKLRKAGIKSGITKLDQEGKPIKDTTVHPHRLRHSYGSHLMNDKKLNLREVQEALRHTSIQSTQIYTHINKENLKEKLNE